MLARQDRDRDGSVHAFPDLKLPLYVHPAMALQEDVSGAIFVMACSSWWARRARCLSSTIW